MIHRITFRLLQLVIPIALLSACAGVGDSFAPSLSVSTDEFDNTKIVSQPPVGASSSSEGGGHTLGFEWRQKHPDTVIITVGITGWYEITGVTFTADGASITDTKPVGLTVTQADWSKRPYSISWDNFMKIADAQSVEMKVIVSGGATVATFGPAHPGAAVNSKFGPFLENVREYRSTK